MAKQDRVWAHSTDQFEIICFSEQVGSSDLIHDNPSIEQAVDLGSADVVRLVAEVRSQGGSLLGSASKHAVEILEHREPFDIMRLDRSAVHDVVMWALAQAVDDLAPVDTSRAADLRSLQRDIHRLTMI